MNEEELKEVLGKPCKTIRLWNGEFYVAEIDADFAWYKLEPVGKPGTKPWDDDAVGYDLWIEGYKHPFLITDAENKY